MRLLLLICALASGATSCTTLSNRRDLYSPSEKVAPGNAIPQKQAVPVRANPTLREEF